MKKLVLLTLFLIAGTLTTNAQGLRFGLKGGANFAKLEGDKVDSDNLTSYYAGAFAEINVFPNFSVQPELLYSSQGAKGINGADDFKLDYINVPVLAKFYLITDVLALEAGPQFGFLVNDNFEDSVNGIGTQYEAESFDFAAIGGVSVNITDNFFANARYVLGLTEVSKTAEVKNTTIQVGLGYRF